MINIKEEFSLSNEQRAKFTDALKKLKFINMTRQGWNKGNMISCRKVETIRVDPDIELNLSLEIRYGWWSVYARERMYYVLSAWITDPIDKDPVMSQKVDSVRVLVKNYILTYSYSQETGANVVYDKFYDTEKEVFSIGLANARAFTILINTCKRILKGRSIGIPKTLKLAR